MPYIIWWMRWLLINISKLMYTSIFVAGIILLVSFSCTVLFVFLFFFTTPPVIIASIDEIRAYFVNISNNSDIPVSRLDKYYCHLKCAVIRWHTVV